MVPLFHALCTQLYQILYYIEELMPKKEEKGSPVATQVASSLDPLQHHVAPVFQQRCPVSANDKKAMLITNQCCKQT